MNQFEQTAAITTRKTVSDTAPTAHVSDYIVSLAAQDAIYYGAAGFGLFLSVIMVLVWYVERPESYASLMISAVACGLFCAGVGGHIRLNKQIEEYKSISRSQKTEESQSQPVTTTVQAKQGNDRLVSLATLTGDVIEFYVPSYQTWLQFLRRAMSDQESVTDSLGRNDAMACGFTQPQWEIMFKLFLDHGLVQERKNRKPIITGAGATAFGRHLGTLPTPNAQTRG